MVIAGRLVVQSDYSIDKTRSAGPEPTHAPDVYVREIPFYTIHVARYLPLVLVCVF